MKPNYVLQCLTSDKFGQITMLEQQNVRWIMRNAEKLRLDLPAPPYNITAKEIFAYKNNGSSFIVQGGMKKPILEFDSNYEAVAFFFSPETRKYSPKVYRPAVTPKDNFMF